MATTDYQPTPNKVYTIQEAREVMRMINKSATTKPPVRWVSVITGRPIYFNY